MSFMRTNSGISNLHLFYNADLTVYTEGGINSYSISEVELGKYNKSSVDIKFWSGVFKAHNLSKKVHFRAVGSKTSAQVIIDKVLSGEIRNTVVACDRDLDHYLGLMKVSPYVIYTKGYSWENDVFGEDITRLQIDSMILEHELPIKVLDLIKDCYTSFFVIGKFIAKAELLFRLNGLSFISCINAERLFKASSPAKLNKQEVICIYRQKAKEIKRPFFSTVKISGLCPYMNNYGKLIKALAVNLINFICRKFSGHRNFPLLLIESTMIERFCKKIASVRDEYYFNLVHNLNSTN
ncbi:conserved hypothetical protein [Candidatus Nitrotoga sp. BS]|uniref:DUF4435 domain-containing protein n=1 Tax=Candidatus Nitrotoga sp. BS TaxID=2890408 RepID=UPI001EF1D795|nr:DUF4435 domain-containing protein [Candidatus Nitrotoga sp. BS]CAH1198115.1 conserved hypothetical protein [Candidatus Nitrotoga sp. BS]